MEQRTLKDHFPALSGVVTHAKQFTRLADRAGSAAASETFDDTLQRFIVKGGSNCGVIERGICVMAEPAAATGIDPHSDIHLLKGW